MARQIPGALPKGYDLDSLLTVEQFACWRQISPLTAKRKIHTTKGVVRLSQMDVRVHPRTFLQLSLKHNSRS